MKALKKIGILVLAIALVLTFAACAGGNSGKQKLKMATAAAFPPYEFKEGDSFAGIDIEIAQKLAEKLDMELEINDVEFGSIIGGIESGKFDVGIAGMSVTEDRLKSVNFSNSYATGVQVVIVKEDSTITSIDDIIDQGATIGVEQDTTGDIYCSDTIENGGFGEDKVVRYKTGNDAVVALQAGKVDCVIIDNEPAKSYVADSAGLKILDTEYVEEEYAIAMNKNATELLDKINKALDEMKADGTMNAIISKYIKAD